MVGLFCFCVFVLFFFSIHWQGEDHAFGIDRVKDI